MRRDYLAWAALAAALSVTASAEYELARACGFGPWVAAGAPAALDIYAVRALRVHRDVLAAVLAMIAVNAASHLVAAGLLPVSVPLVVAVSAIAPLVLWRVHALRGQGSQPAPVPVAAAPEPSAGAMVPAAVEAVPVRPVLGPFPAGPELEERADGAPPGTGAEQVEQHLGGQLDATAATAGTSAGDAPPVPGASRAGRFEQHVAAVRAWLAAEPALTGTAIGRRLGASDSYGRRVRRAALAAR